MFRRTKDAKINSLGKRLGEGFSEEVYELAID